MDLREEIVLLEKKVALLKEILSLKEKMDKVPQGITTTTWVDLKPYSGPISIY